MKSPTISSSALAEATGSESSLDLIGVGLSFEMVGGCGEGRFSNGVLVARYGGMGILLVGFLLACRHDRRLRFLLGLHLGRVDEFISRQAGGRLGVVGGAGR